MVEAFKLFGSIVLQGGKEVGDELKDIENKGKTASDRFQKFNDGMKSVGKRATDTGKKLGTFVTLPLLGLGATAFKVGMDFDSQMSKVQALTGTTGETFAQLEAKAKEMGRTTTFSASQSAEAMEYMGLAGWDATQIMDGLGGVLNLAQAGSLDLATASDIVTDTMSMFGMTAEDSSRASDIFAKAQATSNTNVEQLGEALKYSGATANAMGLELHETSAILGVFANNGIKGSSAGTTLDAMFRDLQASAEKGKLAVEGVNISLYEQDGSMRNITSVMGDIEKATEGLTDEQRNSALSGIFQSQSLRGVNILMGAGIDSVEELSEALDQSAGFGQKMADTMTDNLGGSFASMQSALEGVILDLYTELEPAFRMAIDFITELATKFTEAPTSFKTFAVILGVVLGAIAPVLLIIGFLATAIGTIGLPIAGVIVGVMALIGVFVGLYTTSETFREKVNSVFGMVRDFVTGVIENLVTFVMERLNIFLQFWTQNSDQIKLAWENAFNLILAIIQFIMPIAGLILGGFIDGIKNMFSGLMTFIQGIIQIFTGIFTGDWSMMWDGLKNVLMGALQFIWGLMNVTFLGRIVSMVRNFVKLGLGVFRNFFTGISNTFTSIRTFVSNAVTRVRTAITGAFTGARNKGLSIISSMRAGLSGAWTAIQRVATTAFNNVKNAITKPIETAKKTIGTAVDNIISFFTGLGSKLKITIPKPKMPKFTITGKFGLKPPSVPRLGLNWNAEGGIFDEPTILQGLGEAGKEAILPLDRPHYFKPFAQAIASQMPSMGNGGGFVEAVKTALTLEIPVTLDGKVIARAIANPVNEILERKRQTASRMKGAET